MDTALQISISLNYYVLVSYEFLDFSLNDDNIN